MSTTNMCSFNIWCIYIWTVNVPLKSATLKCKKCNIYRYLCIISYRNAKTTIRLYIYMRWNSLELVIIINQNSWATWLHSSRFVVCKKCNTFLKMPPDVHRFTKIVLYDGYDISDTLSITNLYPPPECLMIPRFNDPYPFTLVFHCTFYTMFHKMHLLTDFLLIWWSPRHEGGDNPDWLRNKYIHKYWFYWPN